VGTGSEERAIKDPTTYAPPTSDTQKIIRAMPREHRDRLIEALTKLRFSVERDRG